MFVTLLASVAFYNGDVMNISRLLHNITARARYHACSLYHVMRISRLLQMYNTLRTSELIRKGAAITMPDGHWKQRSEHYRFRSMMCVVIDNCPYSMLLSTSNV